MRSARNFSIITLLLSVMLQAISAQADNSPFEVQKAHDQLVRQIFLLNEIQKDVERQDLPRVYRLRKMSEDTLTSLDKNGIGNMETIRDYQALVLSYHYSSALLTQISTAQTVNDIQEIESISQTIATNVGLEKPYTMVTEDTFRQIYDLLQTVNQLDISQDLKNALNATRAPIGDLLATASLGDGSNTYTQALPIYKQIRALYPQFNQISMGNAAFNTILNIQSLVEFYASFAQFNTQGSAQ